MRWGFYALPLNTGGRVDGGGVVVAFFFSPLLPPPSTLSSCSASFGREGLGGKEELDLSPLFHRHGEGLTILPTGGEGGFESF